MEFETLRKATLLHPPFKPLPPSTVHLNFGYHCNLNCIYCWHRNPDRRSLAVFKHEKECYDTKKLIRELKKTGVKTIEIAGAGEPLLFKGIMPILRNIKKADLRGHLFTNGTACSEPVIDALIDMRWDFVNFSFDVHSPELFVRLKKSEKELFKSIIAHIRMLTQAKKKRRLRNPHARFSYILNKLNCKFIDEFIDLAISLSVDSIYFMHLGQFSFNQDLALSKKQERAAAEAINRNKRKLKKHNIGVSSYFDSLDWPKRESCLVPWLAPFIVNDGTVYPCCRIRKKMGNIKTDNFKEIWESKKYDAVRMRLRDKKWFKECQDCRIYIS